MSDSLIVITDSYLYSVCLKFLLIISVAGSSLFYLLYYLSPVPNNRNVFYLTEQRIELMFLQGEMDFVEVWLDDKSRIIAIMIF